VMRLSVIGWETTASEGIRSVDAIIKAWQIVKQQPTQTTNQ
jgi:hypothetical protein